VVCFPAKKLKRAELPWSKRNPSEIGEGPVLRMKYFPPKNGGWEKKWNWNGQEGPIIGGGSGLAKKRKPKKKNHE